MQIIHTLPALRAALSGRRDIRLVPTMGNLHEGHLSLVRSARACGGVVVTSIFVNRLQFAPHEDFAQYPRTLEQDCALLAGVGCDIVFAPGDQDMYPQAQTFTVQPPARLVEILEGSVRPGFFTGVSTLVLKLFNIVQPATAVFGKKDYQQLLVIENLVSQFALPIEILAAETVRDAQGLALSSRNGYLNEAQRHEASQLYRELRTVAQAVQSGRSDWGSIARVAHESLSARGWHPDYVAIRRRSDLRDPAATDPLIVLAAARLGGTRLIDNLEF